MHGEAADDYTINVRLHFHEFSMPPVKDALVLGKESPIGCEAVRRALSLLHVATFDHIEPEDDVVGNILVRSSVLKKIPQDKLVALILHRVKPTMEKHECMHLHIVAELFSEDTV